MSSAGAQLSSSSSSPLQVTSAKADATHQRPATSSTGGDGRGAGDERQSSAQAMTAAPAAGESPRAGAQQQSDMHLNSEQRVALAAAAAAAAALTRAPTPATTTLIVSDNNKSTGCSCGKCCRSAKTQPPAAPSTCAAAAAATTTSALVRQPPTVLKDALVRRHRQPPISLTGQQQPFAASHQHPSQQLHLNQQHHQQHLSSQQQASASAGPRAATGLSMAHYKFHNDCQSSVLTYDQVKRLDLVMDQTVPIHGRGNFPTLYVKLKELIRLVKRKLQDEHQIEIRDVMLNGGAASYVLAPENAHYNDLDLVFGTDLSDEDRFDVIRDAVLECLRDFYPEQPAAAAEPERSQREPRHNQMPLSECAIKEAYVHKMVKVNDDDRWSLISLGVQQSEGTQTCCAGQSAARPADGCDCRDQRQVPATLTSEGSPEPGDQQQASGQQQARTPVALDASAGPACDFYEHHLFNRQASHLQPQQHHCQNHQHHHLHNHRHHNQQQQKQFPNNIELKFVDRMRRKFEFSVDSFQIILDSLLQFYDCVPQSTITTSRLLPASARHSPSVVTRQTIKRRCSAGCFLGCADYSDEDPLIDTPTGQIEPIRSAASVSGPASGGAGAEFCTSTKAEVSSAVDGGSEHQLEPANSPPMSSEASSSGCSSSSSVVSSASSSMSCDEDQEDPYCDTYGPSSSSAASTSSLLSSTTTSILSVGELESQSGKSDQTKTGPKKCGDSGNKLQRFAGANSAMEHCDLYEGSRANDTDCCHDCFRSNQTLKLHYLHRGSCTNIYDFNNADQGTYISPTTATSTTSSCAVISENFYPTVIGRSEYGDFKEALYHLEKKLIATRSPEEIRGGGLLKYCNLLVKNYKPTNVYQIRTLERYMCSRFFIDFSELSQQQAKLESYLANHFSDDPVLKFDYLTILHNVVQRSTVCLMNHELRLTLNMIRELAYKLNEQPHQTSPPQLPLKEVQNLQQPMMQQQQQPAQAQQQVQQQQPQQPQQHYYHQQKPILIQSGVYRVKLVNYTLAKPVGGSWR